MNKENKMEYEKLDKEITALKKQIYSKEYEKLVLKYKIKQFDNITYSLKKGINEYTGYEGIVIYAPFLYLIGALDYEPKADTYGIVNYKKKTKKWVWEGTYLDSKSVKLISKNEDIGIDKFDIKMSRGNGKYRTGRVNTLDLKSIEKSIGGV